MKTLDELIAETEPERLAELAKWDAPEAVARRAVRAKAELQNDIRLGLRDESGDWIEQPETDEEEDETEDEE